jgi:hypothetical protein
MPERLTRQLGPEIREVLDLARRVTGDEPVLERAPQLPNDVRAMLIRPARPHRPDEIHLQRGEERVIGHLIAHEVGHLVRLYQVPEEERLMPAITTASRRRAAERILPELGALLSRGLPAEALVELFDVWYQGVCTQLGSFPADLRIEASIRERFPALRRVQERSLREEVRRTVPLFGPEAVALTPPTIYRTTMAMNAAQAYQIADFYSAPELTERFDRHGSGALGARLARMVLTAPDEGHRSDRQATEQWAEALQLTGWFEWRPYTGTR